MPKLLLILAAVGLVVVSLLARAARVWWPFDLLTHFRPQYAATAGVLTLVALATRARAAAAALAAVTVTQAWAILDMRGAPPTSRAEGIPLRVATANVLDTNPTPRKVGDFARQTHADLLVIVDARQPQRWGPVLRGIGSSYPQAAPEGWRNGAPVILFSRYPILHQEVVEPPGGRRPYLIAELSVEGQPLTFVAVHPSSPSPTEARDSRARNRALDDIAEVVRATDGPVIVAGDFNISPWSPHYRDLLATAGLRDAAGAGQIPTWPAGWWPAQVPIDHVLVKGPLSAVHLARGPATGSDHYPLVADLSLGAAEGPAQARSEAALRPSTGPTKW
jgi:endonuclease/exonuclease/phosphatase (EEP) superfamily protein YafD